GGRHLLSSIGSYQLIFWIAPGVLGSLLSLYLTKKYKKVYCEDTADNAQAYVE
ncbi:MAG: hypothetical protein ACI9WH_001949, partial [Glaciecola sp.]